jgi:uncharacterized protein (DUF4415 family)
MPKTKDSELAEFEAALLRSIDQAHAGRYATVHTPADIAARKRGRPAQAVTKVSTTIRFDADVLEALKATGTGWQTRANDALRAHFKIKPQKTAPTAIKRPQSAKA